MESFDWGRVFGQLLMTFALFVILGAALNKITGLSRRTWVAYVTSFVICASLLLSSSAPLEIVLVTLLLLSPLAFWRYRAASKK